MMKLTVILFYIFLLILLLLTPTLHTTAKQNGHTESPASRICKPGPPPSALTSNNNRKCLIIGDSVSIGYERWVAENLKGSCGVIHSPWDYVDGGALDSKYGLQCLTFLLSTARLEEVRYDAIVFNFGLHDVDCFGNSPEEFTPASEYRSNIQRLKASLLETGAKVGFVLTTPIPYNNTRNEMVVKYNGIAGDIMAASPTVETANLYQWVVNVCGEPPYNSCKIAGKQPSPHYTVDGYKYLAQLVTELFQRLLAKEKRQPKEIFYHENVTSEISKKDSSRIECKDKTGKVVSACPSDTTCCGSRYSACGVGCCLWPDAIACGDGKHCCPAGYSCNAQCNESRCYCVIP